jgi:hypothetical protein
VDFQISPSLAFSLFISNLVQPILPLLLLVLVLFGREGGSERRSGCYFAISSLLLLISFYSFFSDWAGFSSIYGLTANGTTSQATVVMMIPTHVLLSILLVLLTCKDWSKTRATHKEAIRPVVVKVITRNKIGFVVVVGALALTVVGGLVSSMGYTQSPQLVTYTQTYTQTSSSLAYSSTLSSRSTILTALTTHTASQLWMTTGSVASFGGVFYSGLTIIGLAIVMILTVIFSKPVRKRKLNE